MADAMAVQGRLHGDIAKSLGISLMTYHRWRKARAAPVQPAPPRTMTAERPAAPSDHEQVSQIRDLQYENSRLRRLLTDLLLEKVRLEEDLRANMFNLRSAGRN